MDENEPLGAAPKTRGMTIEGMAPFYDTMCRLFGLGRAFREKTLELLELGPADRFLEAGCGTGVLTRLAAERVGPAGAAIGIDPGPAMITAARAGAKRRQSRAQFQLAAIERLPFEAGSFDAVAISLVLHHLPPDLRSAGLAEVHRVLKRGGRLVVVDLDRPQNPLWWPVLAPMLMMPQTRPFLAGKVPEFLREAGFDLDREPPIRWGGPLTLWKASKPEG